MEKRIDLDEAKEIMDEHDSTSEIFAELKRMYKREDELIELCDGFLEQALTLYDVGNQHRDVHYDYREFNKLRTRFAELLDYGGHKASE